MKLVRMNSRSGKRSTATQTRTAPAARYQRWSEEELAKLDEMHKKNYSMRAIATILNRPVGSVLDKLTLINLKNKQQCAN